MANLAMVRWVRAIVLSTVIVVSTLAAHVAGGGALPDVSMLLPVCALVTASAAALVGRPLSWWRTAATLLGGQAALHSAIQLLPAPSMTADMGGHAAGDGGGHTVLTGWTGGVGMVLAHVAAALLVGAWLAAGERAVWALVALAAGSMTTAWVRLRHVLLWRGQTGALPSRSRVNAWGKHSTPLALDVLSSGVSRRGPPSTGLA